jgi:hypothetical protein
MSSDARPAGQWEPAELGVHPAVSGGQHRPGVSAPPYIHRPHDALLRRMLDPEVTASRLIVVRGEAYAGKSRAAYEAVMSRLADWRLEYPPTAAALAARLDDGVPPWTVLWLGDLCRYVDADGGVAALSRLAGLLDGEGRLVITTAWPEHWDAYVTAARASRGEGDPLRAAGRLVAGLDEVAMFYAPDPARGGVIDVPARFTAEEVTAAAVRGDPVLAVAAAAAGPDGQVTQCLAGGPALLRRYQDPAGDRYGQAMITAAMDASRLGHAGPLPAALLPDAALGYLPTALAADAASDRAAALAWASTELEGEPRPLEPAPAAVAADHQSAGHRSAGHRSAGHRSAGHRSAGNQAVAYRIAGYLDQHGRRTRRDQLGPASLWDALAAQATGSSPADLIRLAQAARDRGLYRHAATLWTAAAGAGSAAAARRLVAHLREVNPADTAPAARWAVGRVRLDDPWDLARLLEELLAADAGDAVRALLARDPASQAGVGHCWDAVELLGALHAAGALLPATAAQQGSVLAARIVADVSLEHLPSVASLLTALSAAGAADAIGALVTRDPARHAIPEEPEEIAVLLEALHVGGAADAVRSLASWAANDVSLERPQVLARLLKALRAVGAHGAYQVLLARDPVGHGRFDDPWEAAALLVELRMAGADGIAGAEGAAGADGAVQALLARITAGLARVDHTDSIAWLLAELRAAGASEAIKAVLARDPARHADFYDLQAVGRLAAELHAVGDIEAVRTLATRMADDAADADDPGYLAERLEEVRTGGAAPAVQVLLDRDPAGQAVLDDPGNVAWLLDELRVAGAGDQVRVLLARDPAGQVRLGGDPADIARLLRALRTAGASDGTRSLAARAAESARLEEPLGAARLLEELLAARAGDAVRALLARDPARQVVLGPEQSRGVARLLAALRAAGTAQAAQAARAARAARALAERAADAGLFHLKEDRADYPFGREPDGSPASPWRWSAPVGHGPPPMNRSSSAVSWRA